MKINLKPFLIRLSLVMLVVQTAIGFLLINPLSAKASFLPSTPYAVMDRTKSGDYHYLNSSELAKLTSSDDNRYSSNGHWPSNTSSFSDNIEFYFNLNTSENLPSDAILDSVKFVHEYQSGTTTGLTATQYRIFVGSTQIGTNITGTNYPKNTDNTETIDISSRISQLTSLNNLSVRFYGNVSTNNDVATQHDFVSLEVNYHTPVNLAPSVPNLLTPANNSSSSNKQPTLTWQASTDADGTIDHYHVWLHNDTANNDVLIHAYTKDNDYTVFPNLPDGKYSWYVKSVDNKGLESAASETFYFNVDTTAPTATISYSKPYVKTGETVTITATFSEPIGETSAPRISLGGMETMTKVDSTHFTYDTIAPAGNGPVPVIVFGAKDVAGNPMLAVNGSYIVDNIAPVLNGVFDGQISQNPLTITFSDEATLDGSSVTSPLSVGSEGDHTLVVTDQAGNTVTVHFTIDTIAPTATISYSKADSTANAGDKLVITANFSESIVGSPAPQITLSGATNLVPTNMTKISDTQYSYTYLAASGDGAVNVAISGAVDKAGNAMVSPTTSSFNLATTPIMEITQIADNSGFVISYVTNLSSIFLQVSDKSDFSHLVKVVGQSASFGPITITDLPKGITYYFRLQAMSGTVATGYTAVKTGFISKPEVVAPIIQASQDSLTEPIVSSAGQSFVPTAKAAEKVTPKPTKAGDNSADQNIKGEVKSDSSKKDNKNDSKNRNILVVIALLAIAGAAYYGYKRLPESDEISEPAKIETLKNPVKNDKPAKNKKPDNSKKKKK